MGSPNHTSKNKPSLIKLNYHLIIIRELASFTTAFPLISVCLMIDSNSYATPQNSRCARLTFPVFKPLHKPRTVPILRSFRNQRRASNCDGVQYILAGKPKSGHPRAITREDLGSIQTIGIPSLVRLFYRIGILIGSSDRLSTSPVVNGLEAMSEVESRTRAQSCLCSQLDIWYVVFEFCGDGGKDDIRRIFCKTLGLSCLSR